MASPRDVAVLIGSLRNGSLNRKMAKALIAMAPSSLKLREVPIGELTVYNSDLDEAAPPPPWQAFRDALRNADGVLFVTPEYNRSIPGGLKNALDIGSRPYGKSVWSGKPAAVLSVSPGMYGGFGANHHLRQTFVFLDMLPLQQPEAYVGKASDKLFGDDGGIVVPEVRDLATKFLERFADWVERTRPR